MLLIFIFDFTSTDLLNLLVTSNTLYRFGYSIQIIMIPTKKNNVIPSFTFLRPLVSFYCAPGLNNTPSIEKN